MLNVKNVPLKVIIIINVFLAMKMKTIILNMKTIIIILIVIIIILIAINI